MSLSIYIHFPFCKSKCPYCGFVSGYKPEKDAIELYTEALCSEIKLYQKTNNIKDAVNTVYIGGGTPSLLKPVQIKRIFKELKKAFNLKNEENTIEANPEDITLELASSWKETGINRISIGVQSMENRVLKFLGRRNTCDINLNSFELLGKSGFENISMDWIGGIRGEHIALTMNFIFGFKPPHLSVYLLSIEEKTILHHLHEKGKYKPLKDNSAQRHFNEICLKLKEAGYIRYEISNFALSDQYLSRHNLNYWNYGEYIGFGPGAWGYTRQKGNITGLRWTDTAFLKEYFSMINRGILPIGYSEKIDRKTAIREYIMLGLRKTSGILYNHFEELFNESIIKIMIEKIPPILEPFLNIKDDSISLTDKGLSVADRLIRDLWDVL
jgi:oxygen-independent coproporphyrinogen-3 oxidase